MKLTLRIPAIVIAAVCAAGVRAQTALRADLRGSHRVVTNEQDLAALAALHASNTVLAAAITNEAAIRAGTNAILRAAITNEAAIRAGTNAILRAAITNEAAIRAGADAALADLVATGRFTRLLDSGGADEWVSLAAGTATLWRVTETGRTITTNTVTNAVEVADTVTTTNVTDTATTNTAYRGVYVDPGFFWDTNIVFTLQSSVTNIGLASMIKHDYGVIDHHRLYWRKDGRTDPKTGELEWYPGQWSAWYYDWETSPPAVVTNLYTGPGEWPDIGNLYTNKGFVGAHITMQPVTIIYTLTTNIVTTACTNIITNIVTTVYTNVTAETNAVLTYTSAAALTDEAALRAAADLAGIQALYGTNAILRAAITNEAALREAADDAITATSLGALTNEIDLAALRTYHYGSPDIIESPTNWFEFDGAGTITGFTYTNGRENVVIPWQIGCTAVTAIGDWAFSDEELFGDDAVSSLTAPQTVKTIGMKAFFYCDNLVSATLPQVATIGNQAFEFCTSLTSLYIGQNAPAQAFGVFAGISPQPTIYVTNPNATGWGDTWDSALVVRLPVYADAFYQAGLPVATEAHVAQAIAGKVDIISGLASNLWLQGDTIVTDSYTNLLWRNVYSNGWHWLVAYTNTGGGQ